MNPNESAMHLVQFFGESWRVLALLLPARYVQASREPIPAHPSEGAPPPPLSPPSRAAVVRACARGAIWCLHFQFRLDVPPWRSCPQCVRPQLPAFPPTSLATEEAPSERALIPSQDKAI